MSDLELVSFKGTITKVFSEKGTWCAILVKNVEEKEMVNCSGNLLSPATGDELVFYGNYQFDEFGKRKRNDYNQLIFKMEYASFPDLSEEAGLIKYLKKIAGDKTSKKIFDFFGMEALDILNNEPDRLKEVPSISEKKMMKITDKHREFGQRETYIRLGKYMTDRIIQKGIAYFGSDFEERVMQNPYITIDLDGVQFKTADEIAVKMGVMPNDHRRIRSGAIFEMMQIAQNGHCFAHLSSLSNQLSETLRVSGEDKVSPLEISVVIKDMCEKKLLYQEDERVYLPNFYMTEMSLAKRIVDFLLEPKKKIPFNVLDKIPEIEKEFRAIYGDKFNFGSQQIEFLNALDNNFLILRGDPGTGKTTTTRGALRLLEWAFPDYAVSAVTPTGKASKRMSESLGIEAVTMHRELEFNPETGRFNYDEYNKLPKHIILADEVSMFDLFNADMFIKAIELGAKVIFIGDPNQLPSVGPGKVLDDLLDSNLVPTVYLTEIFRQAQDSGIVQNALAINRGEFPSIKTKRNDFIYTDIESPEDVKNAMVERLQEYINFYPLEDIQVLCPKKPGVTGTEQMNILLQEVLNAPAPYKTEFKYGDILFREGDKVIQMKNDFKKLNVSNGDTGVIVKIRFEEVADDDDDDGSGKGQKEVFIDINIDGRLVTYELSDLRNLQLGYAITIHKSQGSEWPIVLIPMTKESIYMGKRNLLFTAVTRAKACCELLGDRKTIWKTVKTVDTSKRNTTLAKRIVDRYEEEIKKRQAN